MKLAPSLALGAALLSLGGAALAQGNPNITIDENGNGTLVFPGRGPITTTGVLAPDPGPGGLSSALTYNLLGPPGLVAGDLRLFDPDGTFSDVVRFNPPGTGDPAYPASVVFYSNPVGGFFDSLADTPSPPSSFYTNILDLTEIDLGNGVQGVVYTPTANDPGFVPGFGVTYTIISDVPEPGSIALLIGFGTAGVGLLARKRRSR